MTILTGTKKPGMGGATHTLAIQLPIMAERFPEIAVCHAGTINLELERPLIVLQADHRTEPIQWCGEEYPGEVFDLVRILFEAPAGSSAVDAWLYVPHGSPHRENTRTHEVLCPRLADIPAGTPCRITILRPTTSLPYDPAIVYVV